MNKLKTFFIEIVQLVAIILMVIFIVWAIIEFNEEDTYLERCAKYTIEWTGLEACNIQNKCSLNGLQTARLMTSNKMAIINCKRATTKMYFDNIFKEDQTDTEVLPEEAKH